MKEVTALDSMSERPALLGSLLLVFEPADERQVSPRRRLALSERTEFVIELPAFAGSFRLLADLVLEQKMDVCDVPLARVTDRFLARAVDELSTWTLEQATEFLALCAVLLELKVGRLLPRRLPEQEEDLLGGVSPDLLYARSLELAAFRRIAPDLAERMAASALLVSRPDGVPEEWAHLYPDPLERVTPSDLGNLARALFAPSPLVDITHVTPIRVSLEEALLAVRSHLRTAPHVRFRDLIEGCSERMEVVVRFLAVLELYREGEVDLAQAGPLGEIRVRWQPEELGVGP